MAFGGRGRGGWLRRFVPSGASFHPDIQLGLVSNRNSIRTPQAREGLGWIHRYRGSWQPPSGDSQGENILRKRNSRRHGVRLVEEQNARNSQRIPPLPPPRQKIRERWGLSSCLGAGGSEYVAGAGWRGTPAAQVHRHSPACTFPACLSFAGKRRRGVPRSSRERKGGAPCARQGLANSASPILPGREKELGLHGDPGGRGESGSKKKPQQKTLDKTFPVPGLGPSQSNPLVEGPKASTRPNFLWATHKEAPRTVRDPSARTKMRRGWRAGSRSGFRLQHQGQSSGARDSRWAE